MISQSRISNVANLFTEKAEKINLSILEELRNIAERFNEGPENDFEREFARFAREQSQRLQREAENWSEDLISMYGESIRAMDRELSQLTNPNPPQNPIPESLFSEFLTFTVASGTAREILKDYPQFQQRASEFQAGFNNRIQRTVNPFFQSTVQSYRNLAAETITPAFRSGDIATRVDLSQRILNEFAEKGIDTVTFPSGHRMSIQAFSEREARSYTNKVALDGAYSRASQRGYDLVRITQYAGASPMCSPYQGGVFSVSGNSDQYPSLDSATFNGSYTLGGGLFHDYCGHQTNPYIPGLSEKLPLTESPQEQAILREMGEAKGNRHIFRMEQEQRRIERQIRMFKRRKKVSLTQAEQQRNEMLVRRWQKKQRQFIDENPFLKRNYKREQLVDAT